MRKRFPGFRDSELGDVIGKEEKLRVFLGVPTVVGDVDKFSATCALESG